jgi:hypothetical protein
MKTLEVIRKMDGLEKRFADLKKESEKKFENLEKEFNDLKKQVNGKKESNKVDKSKSNIKFKE